MNHGQLLIDHPVGGFKGTDLATLAHLENPNACRRGLAQSIFVG